MFLTNISVKKPVLMSMAIMALIIFGVVGYLNLPIDLMPNVELPYVTVQTVYPGAGPEEIETSVIKPIEEQLSTVNNVKSITAYASEGIGFIILEFNLGIDPDLAAIDVKDKIDAILFNLPRDLLKPVIGKFDINAQPIINLALTGPQQPDELRRLAEKRIKERLNKINGVTSISITGGRQREIHVNLYKSRMDALNLNISTISGILASQTANIPGGHVTGNSKEYTVRVQGQFENLEEIRNLAIPIIGSQGGVTTVPLHTIAEIKDAFKEVRELARFNGENSVGLAIQKRSDANTVSVSNNVLKEIKLINLELPEGTKLNIAQDRSQFIKDSVRDMYVNMIIGMVLTAIMLYLFLGDWRVTIIAAATIPASVIATFWGMQALGFTLNMMTLMAIAISVGTLVTNAIIVLENIVRLRDEGMEIRAASVAGADQVLVAVFASVLTNVAVFFPMANMEGITGQFFKPLGLTIVIATLVSLFFSFTMAPLMASRLLKSREANSATKKGGLEQLLDALSVRYEKILKSCISHRIIVILSTAALFFGTLFFVGPRVGTEFFPQGDQGMFSVSIEMPSGSSIAETDRALALTERKLETMPEMSSIYASLGGSGTNTGVNYAELIVQLKDKKERTRSTKEIVNVVRPMLADIPDAKIIVKESQSMGGGTSEGDITIEVTGDEMPEILSIADSIRNLALSVPGLVDVRLTWEAAKPEIKFIPNRQLLGEYGTSVANLGMTLRNSLTGNESALFREENDEYKIRVQYSEQDRSTIDAIENISIPTSKGMIPIKSLSAVKNEGGATNINRKNRQRLVNVVANVASGASGSKAAELQALTTKLQIKPGYKVNFGGQQERMKESFTTLAVTMLLAILLTYMVLAASIESLVQPILIMITIPLGLIGVLWALFLTGRTISMMSLMSMIMLIGVVVNNAILIIDYAHVKEKQGKTKWDSILEACRTKFSAVLMMNLAIVLATLPQALAVQSSQSPFAITAIGGIFVSTLMTLFVIPAMYMIGQKKQPN